jgi:hypothetical protein
LAQAKLGWPALRDGPLELPALEQLPALPRDGVPRA